MLMFSETPRGSCQLLGQQLPYALSVLRTGQLNIPTETPSTLPWKPMGEHMLGQFPGEFHAARLPGVIELPLWKQISGPPIIPSQKERIIFQLPGIVFIMLVVKNIVILVMDIQCLTPCTKQSTSFLDVRIFQSSNAKNAPGLWWGGGDYCTFGDCFPEPILNIYIYIIMYIYIYI